MRTLHLVYRNGRPGRFKTVGLALNEVTLRRALYQWTSLQKLSIVKCPELSPISKVLHASIKVTVSLRNIERCTTGMQGGNIFSRAHIYMSFWTASSDKILYSTQPKSFPFWKMRYSDCSGIYPSISIKAQKITLQHANSCGDHTGREFRFSHFVARLL